MAQWSRWLFLFGLVFSWRSCFWPKFRWLGVKRVNILSLGELLSGFFLPSVITTSTWYFWCLCVCALCLFMEVGYLPTQTDEVWMAPCHSSTIICLQPPVSWIKIIPQFLVFLPGILDIALGYVLVKLVFLVQIFEKATSRLRFSVCLRHTLTRICICKSLSRK